MQKLLLITTCKDCSYRYPKINKCCHSQGRQEVVGDKIPEWCPLPNLNISEDLKDTIEEILEDSRWTNEYEIGTRDVFVDARLTARLGEQYAELIK